MIVAVDAAKLESGSEWQEKIRYKIGLTMSPDNGVIVGLEKRV